MSGVEWTSTLTSVPNFVNGINIGGMKAFGTYNPTVVAHDGNFTTCSVSPSTLTYVVSGGTLVTLGFLLTVETGFVSATGNFAPIEISLPSNCATTGNVSTSILGVLLNTETSPSGGGLTAYFSAVTTTVGEGYVKIYIFITTEPGTYETKIDLTTIALNFSYLSVGF